MTKRHSKNQTSSGRFSYHERQQLKDYGTKKERLGKDSLKSFDSCSICLNTLLSPLACQKGHLYCKECIYTSLLNQKKVIKEKEELYKIQESKQKIKEESLISKQTEQELKEFESNNITFLNIEKEKLEKIEKINNEGKDLIKEKELKLNCYWMKSHDAKEEVHEKPDSNTKCPEGDHYLRLKQLITVKFKTTNDDNNNSSKCICPICEKILTNSHKLVLLKRCGHVICDPCLKRFTDDPDNLKSSQCFVCYKDFDKYDIIKIQSGGTGFAGSDSKLEAKKYTTTAII